MTPQRFTLRAGALALDVLPAVGGSIARFDILGPAGRQPLLRGTDENYVDVLASACFPLVPYANRIRGGRFQCDGRAIHLACNLPGDASPLHGQGWRAAWSVEHAQEDGIDLLYRHAADEWPWTYASRQRISLSPEACTVTLDCRNLSDRPMPCGLGLHPYYPCTPQTLLDTDVSHVWSVDADVLPVDRLSATAAYSLQNRLICGQNLDNGFDGWSGKTRIAWPERGVSLELSSPDTPYFQVYSPDSPENRGFFAAEPVQHANAALNAPQAQWRQLGIQMLAPGESRQLVSRFTVLGQAPSE
ncbi:MAG: aldose 1-epimerase [Polaromonas sp.]|nr:aldose 1-epimerase [Polaromonas sp.]